MPKPLDISYLIPTVETRIKRALCTVELVQFGLRDASDVEDDGLFRQHAREALSAAHSDLYFLLESLDEDTRRRLAPTDDEERTLALVAASGGRR